MASSRAGTVHDIQTGYGPGACNPALSGNANWVFISHGGGQYTYYAHLSTVNVTVGQQVSAGQRIGVSGESGYSCGAHLHYSLHNATNWWNTSTSLVPDGRWTTNPGRVPFLAAYVREHSAAGYTVLQGSQWTTWVEVRNDGGRTWTWTNDSNGKGRVFLDATTSTGGQHRVSWFFVAGDWETNSRPGRTDQNNIAPGQTARITFQLRATSVGQFSEYFNLGALSLTYFNYAYLSGFYIPITVNHCC